MQKNKTRKILFGLFVALIALYFPLSHVSLVEFLGAIKEIQYPYLILAMIMSFCVYLARIRRWEILVSPLKPVKTFELLSPMMIGLLGNLLPLRLGEIFRAYLLKRKLDLPFASSLATIMVERMFDIFMLLTLFSWTLFYHANIFHLKVLDIQIPLDVIAYRFGVVSFGCMVVVLLFMFLMVLRKNTFLPQIYKLIKLLPLKLQDKAEHLLRTFVKGLDIVKDRGVLINALIYTVLEWVILTISAYPLFLAVGVNDKSLESMILLAVFIPIIITVLPTPAFLGSVQVAAFLVLHEIMNESALVATTYGMIAWVSGIVLTFLAGSYFVFHEHISIKRVIAMEEEGEVDLDKL